MADSAVVDIVRQPVVMGMAIPLVVVAYEVLSGQKKASDMYGILNNVVLPLGFAYASLFVSAGYLGINQPIMASAVAGLVTWGYYMMVEGSIINKIESNL